MLNPYIYQLNMNIDYNLNEIHKVAEKVTEKIDSNIILLSGEVGAGKTTLIKEILKLLKVNGNVNSPTFSIINEHITENNNIIYHIDLYRIKNIDELHSIGFFEYIESNNLCFIEWGDMIEKGIRDSYNKFIIEKRQNNRIIKMVK